MFIYEHIVSFFLSCVVYDENNCIEKIQKVFPRFKCHFETDEHQTFFHGVVLDSGNRRAWAVHRGTDGKDKLGRLMSWYNNLLNAKTGENGIGDGVEVNSKHWFESFKNYLYDYNTWYHTGHSKGGDDCIGTALMHCQNKSPKQKIICHPFANFPILKNPAAAEFQSRCDAGEIECIRVLNPGDPAGDSFFRDTCGGKDIGMLITLPDINKYDPGIAGWVNHSCKMYAAAISIYLSQDKTSDLEKYWLVGDAFKICMN